MEPHTIQIRAVAYKEGSSYIAQGLEYDICAQAHTLEDLHKKFIFNVVATIAVCVELGRKPLEGIAKAPEEFWRMFDDAKELTLSGPSSPRTTPVPIPAISSTMKWVEMAA